MGLTKRRLEAEEADVNAELRLCIACGERIEYEWHDGVTSTRFEHSAIGPFTTIWLCGCTEIVPGRCVRCEEKADVSDIEIPFCSDCLAEYEDKVSSKVMDSACDRCGSPIPRGELDGFFDTGMCGWCSHMEHRLEVEDVERDDGPAWNPERDLQEYQQRIITPEEFLTGESVLIADPRLIRYLYEHPEEIFSLSPRQFEELVAGLLENMGYGVRLGPKGADGGVDVFAERDLDTGPELVLVQCKQYSPHKKVSEPVVKLLDADISNRRASRGLVVTTSTFTKPALSYISERQYRLGGVDEGKLHAWFQKLRDGKGRAG